MIDTFYNKHIIIIKVRNLLKLGQNLVRIMMAAEKFLLSDNVVIE